MALSLCQARVTADLAKSLSTRYQNLHQSSKKCASLILWLIEGINTDKATSSMKTLREKLEALALEMQPVLDEVLEEVEADQ
jgi:hypothetical protein